MSLHDDHKDRIRRTNERYNRERSALKTSIDLPLDRVNLGEGMTLRELDASCDRVLKHIREIVTIADRMQASIREAISYAETRAE